MSLQFIMGNSGFMKAPRFIEFSFFVCKTLSGANAPAPPKGELFIESAHSKALPFGRAGIAQQ